MGQLYGLDDGRLRGKIWLGIGVALLLAGRAQAGEVLFSFGATGEYDSNVFRTSDSGREVDDFIFRFVPSVLLRDELGGLSYNLRYSAPLSRASRPARR